MGILNLSVNKAGPYIVTVREISEAVGNRYTGPNPTSSLTNLQVNFDEDLSAQYIISVATPDGSCKLGSRQFTYDCGCPVLPTILVTQQCDPPRIFVTGDIEDESAVLNLKVTEGGNVIFNDTVETFETVEILVENGKTYSRYHLCSIFFLSQ